MNTKQSDEKWVKDFCDEISDPYSDTAPSESFIEYHIKPKLLEKLESLRSQEAKRVEEAVRIERETWVQRLPEDTFSITIEGRVEGRVLSNRKFVSIKSIQASGGTTLLLESEASAHEMLQALTDKKDV